MSHLNFGKMNWVIDYKSTKYKNVKLVHPSDSGYQAYRYSYILAKQSKRTSDYIAQEPSYLLKASKIVEKIARYWYGSEVNRIIQYDVLYNGTYQRHYKECDIIKIEDDGSITIGEIKASYKPSACKAASQLEHSAEILSSIFYDVNAIAITVNMASLIISANLNQPVETDHLTMSGFSYKCISLTLGDIMGIDNHKAIKEDDSEVLISAYKEALECVRNRMENKHLILNENIKSEETTAPSVFGLLLQDALNRKCAVCQ